MVPRGHTKILIVDDNEVNCMIAASILKKFNMDAEEVYSGNEAIKLCRKNQYDIVLMDYLMPDINGIETTKIIREQDKHNKIGIILALTAEVSHEIENLFLEAGAQGVLEKPISFVKLRDVLKQWFSFNEIVYEKEPREDKKTPLEFALEGVGGLQWKKAISVMSQSVENYVKILRVSCGNIKEQVNQIRNTQPSEELTNLQIFYHSLKGIFGNIGAEKLSEEALLFERAIKNKDIEYIIKQKKDFLLKVDLFLKELEGVFVLYEKLLSSNVTVEAKTMEKELFFEKLEYLKKVVERFEFNEIPDLLKELMAASQGSDYENLQKAEAALQLFEYEEALEYLSLIKK